MQKWKTKYNRKKERKGAELRRKRRRRRIKSGLTTRNTFRMINLFGKEGKNETLMGRSWSTMRDPTGTWEWTDRPDERTDGRTTTRLFRINATAQTHNTAAFKRCGLLKTARTKENAFTLLFFFVFGFLSSGWLVALVCLFLKHNKESRALLASSSLVCCLLPSLKGHFRPI